MSSTGCFHHVGELSVGRHVSPGPKAGRVVCQAQPSTILEGLNSDVVSFAMIDLNTRVEYLRILLEILPVVTCSPFDLHSFLPVYIYIVHTYVCRLRYPTAAPPDHLLIDQSVAEVAIRPAHSCKSGL